jgi:serine/threonine protein kinase
MKINSGSQSSPPPQNPLDVRAKTDSPVAQNLQEIKPTRHLALQQKIYGKKNLKKICQLPMLDIPRDHFRSEGAKDAKAQKQDLRIVTAEKWSDKNGWHLKLGDAHFRLGKKIGEGYSGFVNLAIEVIDGKDAKDSNQYVFKLSKTIQSAKHWQELSGELSYLKVWRESMFVGACDHPNILPMIAAGFCQQRGFEAWQTFTLTPYASQDLFDQLTKGPFPSLSTRLEWGIDLLKAVLYLGSLGIAHRDLKPDNVLVTKKGRVKICDFETCRTKNPMQSLVGTKLYLAPEIYQRSYNGHLVDCFGLGMILYILFTGSPPSAMEAAWIPKDQWWDQYILWSQVLRGMKIDPPSKIEQIENKHAQAAADSAVTAVSYLLQKDPNKRKINEAGAALTEMQKSLLKAQEVDL